MDGKWEAAIKSMKHHLQRTIADALLTYKGFSTLLVQVEAVLNSHPLSALSDDPEDFTALMLGHLRVQPLARFLSLVSPQYQHLVFLIYSKFRNDSNISENVGHLNASKLTSRYLNGILTILVLYSRTRDFRR